MRLRKVFRKIHRWVGLLSALWLLQLTLTGLLLQHADRLQLGSTFTDSPAVLKWFDYGKSQLAWDSDNGVFYQIDDVVSLVGKQFKQSARTVAAMQVNDDWYAVTEQVVYHYNKNGELVMQIEAFDGLPTPIDKAGLTSSGLVIKSAGKWAVIDDNGLVLPMNDLDDITISQPRNLTDQEQKTLLPLVFKDRLSYDKILLGIHSGMKASVLLNTLSALALLYLCISGIYLFFKQPKRKNQSRN